MSRIEVLNVDITTLSVDVVVNAADRTLGGAGIDSAIHRVAGPELLAECRTLGIFSTGVVKLTRGYRLPARHVIHTVGPVWKGGSQGEDAQLGSCYSAALQLAARQELHSIAFPAISCGIFGFPADRAAFIVARTLNDELPRHRGITRVVLAIRDPLVEDAFRQALKVQSSAPTR